jgi:hypothetical protein
MSKLETNKFIILNFNLSALKVNMPDFQKIIPNRLVYAVGFGDFY